DLGERVSHAVPPGAGGGGAADRGCAAAQGEGVQLPVANGTADASDALAARLGDGAGDGELQREPATAGAGDITFVAATGPLAGIPVIPWGRLPTCQLATAGWQPAPRGLRSPAGKRDACGYGVRRFVDSTWRLTPDDAPARRPHRRPCRRPAA